MTSITNAGNLRQYKNRFSVIVGQTLTFPSNSNLVRKFSYVSPNFKRVVCCNVTDIEQFYRKTLINNNVCQKCSCSFVRGQYNLPSLIIEPGARNLFPELYFGIFFGKLSVILL